MDLHIRSFSYMNNLKFRISFESINHLKQDENFDKVNEFDL